MCIELFVIFSDDGLNFCGICGDFPFIIFYCINLSILLFLINMASGLFILLIFSKNQLLHLLIFWKVFCCSVSFSSALILVIYCLLLAFEFFWSCSFSSFNFDDRVSNLDLSILLIWVLVAIYFPLETALNVSQRFWHVVSSFSLVSKNFFISAFISLFTQSTFKSQLFSFHEAVRFWVCFWILSSNLIALWSERLFVMISVLLHLLRTALHPIMWLVLE